MKRLLYLVLVLPALLLRAVFRVSAKTVSAKGTVVKTTPSGRMSRGLDLGLEMTEPLSQPVLVLCDGAKAEFERDQIEVLLQVHHAKARLAEHLTLEMLAQEVADVEQYIVEYPDGEWTPGLRVAMGKFYWSRSVFQVNGTLSTRLGGLLAVIGRETGSFRSTMRWHDWLRSGQASAWVEELHQIFLSNPTRYQNLKITEWQPNDWLVFQE